MDEKIEAKIVRGQMKRHRLYTLLRKVRFSVAGVFPLDYTVACTVSIFLRLLKFVV